MALQDVAREAAQRYGIDPNLFLRQLNQESGFNATIGSPAGAVGVGQFMPGTWSMVINQHPEIAQQFGVTADPGHRTNGPANIYAAAAHMRDLVDQFGNYRDALIAYNAGPGTVGQALPAETESYLSQILGGITGFLEGVVYPGVENMGGIQELIDAGVWIEVGPGVYYDVEQFRLVDLNQSPGGAGRSWLPGEYELNLRAQQATETRTRLDRDLERYRIDLDYQINSGQLGLARQTEARIAQVQQQQLQLDQYLGQLNYQLGLMGLGVDQRGQDITARGQDYDYLLGGRGQDITVRGQDISQQLEMLGLEYQDAQNLRNYALSIGDQQQAQDAENRMRYAQESSQLLTQRAQDIDLAGLGLQGQIAQNNQMIDAFGAQSQAAEAQGNLGLATWSAQAAQQLSQQNIALDQYSAQLQGAGLGLQAQQSALGGYTDLAGLERQRHSELFELQANPRDWMQLQYAQGGGENILQQILNGQMPTGQSAIQAGDTPLLGAGFEQLVGMLGQTPAFDAAMQQAGQLGQFQAPGAPDLAFLLGLGNIGAPPPPPAWPEMQPLNPITPPQVEHVQFPELPQSTYTQPPAGQPVDLDSVMSSIWDAINTYAPPQPAPLPAPAPVPPRITQPPQAPTGPISSPVNPPGTGTKPGSGTQTAPRRIPGTRINEFVQDPRIEDILVREAQPGTTGNVSSIDALLELQRAMGLI